MSRRKINEESSDGPAEWLLTYSDLVTLLLTFFVLLFSMATIDKQKFEEIATSLRSSFMHTSSGELLYENKGKQLISILDQNNAIHQEDSQRNDDPDMTDKQHQEAGSAGEKLKAQKLQKAKEQIEEAVTKLNMQDFVTIVEEKHSLILRIDSVILFDLGCADIKPEGRDILRKLGGMLNELEHDIVIQGHTDNLPINTTLFPTNWELSTKRATNVVIFLVDICGLTPENLTATGNGEFRPIRPNNTEENRQKNRRIDIVIDK